MLSVNEGSLDLQDGRIIFKYNWMGSDDEERNISTRVRLQWLRHLDMLLNFVSRRDG